MTLWFLNKSEGFIVIVLIIIFGNKLNKYRYYGWL